VYSSTNEPIANRIGLDRCSSNGRHGAENQVGCGREDREREREVEEGGGVGRGGGVSVSVDDVMITKRRWLPRLWEGCHANRRYEDRDDECGRVLFKSSTRTCMVLVDHEGAFNARGEATRQCSVSHTCHVDDHFQVMSCIKDSSF
jgi:hypothetical protein